MDIPTPPVAALPTPKPDVDVTPSALAYEDMADDDLMAEMDRLLEAGDMDGFERVALIVDARDQAATNAAQSVVKQWEPDPWDYDNPETYKWFDEATDAQQDAFLAGMRDEEKFWIHRQEWMTGKAVTPVKKYTEAQMREEFEITLLAEMEKVMDETGLVQFMKRGSPLADDSDLWRVNEVTAWKWATDELKEYWSRHGGRLTLGRFKQIMSGDALAAREVMLKGAQGW